MDVQGYKWVRWRVWLCRLAAVLSLGVLLIVFHWRPRLAVLARCCSCPLALADILLLRDSFGQQHVVEVHKVEMEEGSLESLGDLEDTEWRDTVQLYKEEKTVLRYYLFEGLRYIWLDRKGAFCRVSVLNEDWTCKDLYGFQKGLSHLEQSVRRRVYGSNLIDVPVKPYIKLLFEEVLNPFYVFQLFSITLWMIDNYFIYAISIFIISILSICISLYDIRKQSVTLRNMARLVTNVTVRRNSGVEECVSSEDLVPGDCIIIPQEGLLLPCDAALLAGECLVNEGMLTGESVPVLKTQLPAGEGTYSSETERRHTLFCGTQLIRAKGGGPGGNGAIAVVTSTGFFTAKGNLVSSILYPQPTNFRFYQDSAKFLLVLGFIAFIGTIYSFVALLRTKATWFEMVIRSLDIVTIAVPPALPAAITTGTIYAQRRLKSKGVFCISPPRINICGKVSVFCFDKTGTLTEEGLDVSGVMEGGPSGFSELVPEPRFLPPGHMLSGLACCHTVTLLRGVPLGDPLELKMVESTGWTLEEPVGDGKVLDAEFGGHKVLAVMRPPTSTSEVVAILKRFPFSSALQRMSVVVRKLGEKHMDAYLKGAPEVVASLCKQHTVPQSFTETLETYTRQGFRVIALAHRQLESKLSWHKVQNLSRDLIETNMEFLGLIIMQNKIKEETAGVLCELRQADIRTLMVTGDNMLTAISVARDCGMVRGHERVIIADAVPPKDFHPASITWRYTENPAQAIKDNQTVEINLEEEEEAYDNQVTQQEQSYHFAVNGRAFAVITEHFPQLLQKLVLRATVFARMAPDQKTQLVEILQSMDYTVGMCGDGANDCGALKRAHSGISLSELEASVASPFTSSTSNISCVPNLIREGRAALITSFCVFKFMALYSIIQYLSVTLLYSILSNLGDFQFLFIDIAIILIIAFTMSLNPSWKELVWRRPPSSLISGPLLCSVLTQILTCLVFQVLAFLLVRQQSWYETWTPQSDACNVSSSSLSHSLNVTSPHDHKNIRNYENTTLFYVSSFQYLAVAIVFSKGKPFRQPSYKNWPFMLSCICLYTFLLLIMLYPVPAIDSFLEIVCVPHDWRVTLVIIVIVNAAVSFMLEILILDIILWRLVFRGNQGLNRPTESPSADAPQEANNHWGSSFLSWLFCQKNKPPRVRYMHLALELQDDADWPPRPSTVTYASEPQSHMSNTL